MESKKVSNFAADSQILFGCTPGTVYASAEAYLCVKAKADPDPARGLDGDVTCRIQVTKSPRCVASYSNLKKSYNCMVVVTVTNVGSCQDL